MCQEELPRVLLWIVVLGACATTSAQQGSQRKQAFALVVDNQPKASVIIGADAGQVEQTAVSKFLAGVQRDGLPLPAFVSKRQSKK